MADPSYVQLANRLKRGIVADVQGSGWSISGSDVLPFPDDPAAKRFVKKALKDGKLEPASKAEWEEIVESVSPEEGFNTPEPTKKKSTKKSKSKASSKKAKAKAKAEQVPEDEDEEDSETEEDSEEE